MEGPRLRPICYSTYTTWTTIQRRDSIGSSQSSAALAALASKVAQSNFASRALLKDAAFGRSRRSTAAKLIVWHIAEGALAAGVAERQVGLPLLRSRRHLQTFAPQTLLPAFPKKNPRYLRLTNCSAYCFPASARSRLSMGRATTPKRPSNPNRTVQHARQTAQLSAESTSKHTLH